MMMITQTADVVFKALFAQAQFPPPAIFGEAEVELCFYRRRTIALLKRYARCSVEIGRLPSMLGREFFRSRVTSYSMRNFEDVMIFVTDMEQAIEKLGPVEKRLVAMNILEEYSQDEVGRILRCNVRTVRRLLQDALDDLSRILLESKLLESCQEQRSYKCEVSGSKNGENKYSNRVRVPPADLVS